MADAPVNFKDLLDKKVEDTERPKPVPVGTYRLQIQGHEFGRSSQKKTPYVRFSFKIVQPGEDAEMSDLEGINWGKKTLRDDFYLTEDAMYRLRDFLEKNLQLNGTGRSFDELLPETKNMELEAYISQNPSQKEGDDSIYNNIDRYL